MLPPHSWLVGWELCTVQNTLPPNTLAAESHTHLPPVTPEILHKDLLGGVLVVQHLSKEPSHLQGRVVAALDMKQPTYSQHTCLPLLDSLPYPPSHPPHLFSSRLQWHGLPVIVELDVLGQRLVWRWEGGALRGAAPRGRSALAPQAHNECKSKEYTSTLPSPAVHYAPVSST